MNDREVIWIVVYKRPASRSQWKYAIGIVEIYLDEYIYDPSLAVITNALIGALYTLPTSPSSETLIYCTRSLRLLLELSASARRATWLLQVDGDGDLRFRGIKIISQDQLPCSHMQMHRALNDNALAKRQ